MQLLMTSVRLRAQLSSFTSTKPQRFLFSSPFFFFSNPPLKADCLVMDSVGLAIILHRSLSTVRHPGWGQEVGLSSGRGSLKWIKAARNSQKYGSGHRLDVKQNADGKLSWFESCRDGNPELQTERVWQEDAQTRRSWVWFELEHQDGTPGNRTLFGMTSVRICAWTLSGSAFASKQERLCPRLQKQTFLLRKWITWGC